MANNKAITRAARYVAPKSKSIITIICDDEKDAQELLKAFERKTEILWHSDSKKAMMHTDIKKREILISKSIDNYPPIRV